MLGFWTSVGWTPFCKHKLATVGCTAVKVAPETWYNLSTLSLLTLAPMLLRFIPVTVYVILHSCSSVTTAAIRFMAGRQGAACRSNKCFKLRRFNSDAVFWKCLSPHAPKVNVTATSGVRWEPDHWKSMSCLSEIIGAQMLFINVALLHNRVLFKNNALLIRSLRFQLQINHVVC